MVFLALLCFMPEAFVKAIRSPLSFLCFVMDTLARIFSKSKETGIIDSMGHDSIRHRCHSMWMMLFFLCHQPLRISKLIWPLFTSSELLPASQPTWTNAWLLRSVAMRTTCQLPETICSAAFHHFPSSIWGLHYRSAVCARTICKLWWIGSLLNFPFGKPNLFPSLGVPLR